MNEQSTNDTERDVDPIAQKLSQVAEGTHANGHFAAELEQKLRSAHRPQTGWFVTFRQISPTLRWVALMVLLAVVLSWSIRSLIPAPQPATDNTPASPNLFTPTPGHDGAIDNPTPAPNGEGIDFRGAKLFMNADLPNSPGQTNIYQVIQPQPVTAAFAQSLAQQFGIPGDVYLTNGQTLNATAYMVTDGKQQLVVYGENNYIYTSDMVTAARNYAGFENANAEANIREFLQSHGFNTNFRLVDSGTLGGYLLQQLTPDGLPIEYDDYSQPVRITLNENGEVLSMTAVLASYDPNGLGSFGIISAEEALQRVLDDSISAGKLEASYSGPDESFVPPQVWYHEYPENETVTIYGNISSSKAADAGKPAIVFIDAVQVVGNTEGMEALDYYTFIEATGQFVIENGVRRFNVESWNKDVANASFFGGLRREGDQVIVNDQNGGSNAEYVLIDPPADLPSEVNFPESAVTVNGAAVEGKLYWTILDYYADSNSMGGGGGGGGGGLGFYPLNLSGAPIPFPTPTATLPGPTYTNAELASFQRHTVQEGDTLLSIAATYNVSVDNLLRANNITETTPIAVGWVLTIPGVPGPTRLDGEEGTMQVQIYQKPDGRLREAYTFSSTKDQMYYQVKGENVKQLQEVANLPIKIWGAISYDEMGTAWLTFEKFELAYPGLQFEVLTGTQQNTELNGGSVVLFTSEGTTYIQVTPNGGYPDYSTYDSTAEVLLEVLRVPNEIYNGYPTVRVFRSGLAVDPTTGQKMELPPVTNQPDIYPDPYGNADAYIQPDVTIESVELIYLTNNPAYRDSENPDAPIGQGYIQPVWHFKGHYSNGDVLEIFVQALLQDYLSPNFNQ